MARAREALRNYDRPTRRRCRRLTKRSRSHRSSPKPRALRTRVQEAIVRQRQAALERQGDEHARRSRTSLRGGKARRRDRHPRVGWREPRIATALEALRARAALLAREQEEARQRDEAIAAAIARAKAVTSHEEAIAILNEAQALDPARTDVRALLEIRHAAFEIEKEMARRASSATSRFAP